uniref:Uncharacterized protein n=1 Tax=Magallana gigas TaxID=29159 RepID=K1QZL7_MAGGI
MTFSLVNFFNDRKYLLNMNISHSYESSRNDTVLYVLFKDSLIPKDVCEWSMDYNIKGFSLFLWKVDRHLPTAKLSIPDEYLLQLMDETGLAGYTDNPMCNTSVGIYSTTAANGWTSGCGMIMNLPNLHADVKCVMLSTCNGEPEEFSLLGIYRVRYTIEDLFEDRSYLVSLEAMDCYETRPPQCDTGTTYTILNRAVFPKGLCTWNQSFVDPTCAKMVIKPNISGAVCHLQEDCTSVECCVGVEYLTRNVKIFLTIDPCTSELQVGQKERHWLAGVNKGINDSKLSLNTTLLVWGT